MPLNGLGPWCNKIGLIYITKTSPPRGNVAGGARGVNLYCIAPMMGNWSKQTIQIKERIRGNVLVVRHIIYS
jgi:hypothetical protein